MSRTKQRLQSSAEIVLGDIPISNKESDFFDFWPSARNLASELIRVSDGSGVVAAVLGEWGSGKTGFMRLVEQALKERESKDNIIVWFSAWHYQDSGQMGDVLIYKLFQRASEQMPGLKKTLLNLEVALGKRKTVIQYAGQALSIARDVSAAMAPTPVQSALKAAKKAADAFVDQIKPATDIQTYVDELANQLDLSKKRVLILVDDLDRTYPHQIAAVLGALRIYLERPRICVLLAYDEGYVLQALKGQLPSEVPAERYVQKIVTLRVQLPARERKSMEIYCQKLLRSTLPNPRDASDYFYHHAAGTLIRLTNGNPRRIKRIALSATHVLEDMFAKHGVLYAPGTSAALADFFERTVILLLLSEASPRIFSQVGTAIMNADEPEQFQASVEQIVNSEEFKRTMESSDVRSEVNQYLTFLSQKPALFNLQWIVGSLGKEPGPGHWSNEEQDRRERTPSFLEDALNREVLRKSFQKSVTIPGRLVNLGSAVKLSKADLKYPEEGGDKIYSELTRALPKVIGIDTTRIKLGADWAIGMNKEECWIIYSYEKPEVFRTEIQLMILLLVPLLVRQSKIVNIWLIGDIRTSRMAGSDEHYIAEIRTYLSDAYGKNVRFYYTADRQLEDLRTLLVSSIATP